MYIYICSNENCYSSIDLDWKMWPYFFGACGSEARGCESLKRPPHSKALFEDTSCLSSRMKIIMSVTRNMLAARWRAGWGHVSREIQGSGLRKLIMKRILLAGIHHNSLIQRISKRHDPFPKQTLPETPSVAHRLRDQQDQPKLQSLLCCWLGGCRHHHLLLVLTSVAPKGIKRPASNQLILEWYMQLKHAKAKFSKLDPYPFLHHNLTSCSNLISPTCLHVSWLHPRQSILWQFSWGIFHCQRPDCWRLHPITSHESHGIFQLHPITLW